MKYTIESRRIELEKVKLLAALRGGICLSNDYVNRSTKLRWRCSESHEWEAIPLAIENNQWCKICGDKRQGQLKSHSITMMQQTAKSRGGQCLSTTYVNNSTKLSWRCKAGHEWQAIPGSVTGTATKIGTWCPICAGKLPKDVAIENLKKIAVARGGFLLSPQYEGAKTPLNWQCSIGHTWMAIPDSIKRGTWCRKCSGTAPLNLEMMKTHANKYGGDCISEKYMNSRSHLIWRCAEGHEWGAKSEHVLKGHWCPICSSGVSERICRSLFERITGFKFPKQKPSWLKNNRGNQMELDGYAAPINIAFEYQGQQHYENVPFFHQEKNAFDLRQNDDSDKRQLCKCHGITLLEIHHSIQHEQLQEHITNLLTNIDITLIKESKYINISELGIRKNDEINHLRSIATLRGGLLLSDYYINNSTKLKWRCAEGHEWNAVPASVKQGTWCSICGDKIAAIKRAKTIVEMRILAEARNGFCTSTEYLNSKSHLRWRCSEGHEWTTSASVIASGHWCPKCEKIRLGKKYALTIESVRESAKKRGGECLSDSYINSRQKLLWRCQSGHVWQANTNSIRRGTWCPICIGRKIESIQLPE